MPRLPYPDLSAKPDPVRTMCESNPLNLTRMMAHASPAAFVGFNKFVSTLYMESALRPDLREIGILRAGHLAGAAYETTHHEAIALGIGMTKGQLAAIRTGDSRSPALDPAQQAVLAFAEEFIVQARVGDEALSAVRQHMTDEQLMDLMLVIGVYMTVSRIMETSGIPLDDHVMAPEALEQTLAVAAAQSVDGR